VNVIHIYGAVFNCIGFPPMGARNAPFCYLSSAFFVGACSIMGRNKRLFESFLLLSVPLGLFSGICGQILIGYLSEAEDRRKWHNCHASCKSRDVAIVGVMGSRL